VYQGIGHLFGTRRFLPFFVTQSFSAFNDNIFKFAIAIVIKYQMTELSQGESQTLVTLATGIFILPFFLFSATAGQLADKYEKSRLIRIIRFSEIPLMLGAAVGFYLQSVELLLFILFLMGAKSGLFGPLKYSILPVHLRRDELLGGNGLVEMATFLAILLGTIVGGLLTAAENGTMKVSGLIILLAVSGYWASRYIPPAPSKNSKLRVNPNIFVEMFRVVASAMQNRAVFLSIVGISWLWFVGITLMAQFPNFAKDVVGGDEEVATLMLFALSAGIGLGSLLCNRLLKGAISSKAVPWTAFLMGAFCIDLFLASLAEPVPSGVALAGVAEFLRSPNHWRVLFDLFVVAVAGGIYIVPLYSILQIKSHEDDRSRMVAANNIVNAFFMVVSSLGTIGLFRLGLSVSGVLLVLGLATLAVGGWYRLHPGWENRQA
jgi:acyl-[acyl-carrier-protein]-phospholipid O-acyltransferase / long-chain-fatty-acid--[acyl-carrier-protein] ligase